MIPRRMHQIWLGPRPRPAEWMGTWRTQNPTFAYRVWDEPALDELGLRNRQVFERFMAEGVFDGAADVARIEILHREGGIYLDADSIAVGPIDDGLLEAGFFAVTEPSPEDGALIGNACIGARARHPVLERYLDAISRVEEIHPMWRLTGPGALTEVLAGSSERDIEILPAWSFYATTIDGGPVAGGAPFGHHLWSTTAERWGRAGGTPYPDFAGLTGPSARS